ncbi:MAG: uracil-DNA glycosylase [Gallionella sp.]|nr:uracil-DNA glycosylase [Gallionella sp.]
MDRNEAVLRELNLYPQWVRRGKPASVETAIEATHSVSPGPSGKPSSLPTGSLKSEGTVAGDSAIGEACAAAAVVPVGKADNSRALRIGELDWPQLKATVRDCTACKLRAGCTQTVFGVGDEQADWLFVGEGPGEEEDARGEPFVGQAGKLLDNMLMAIKLKRGENVYIANVVKCRPPNNRNPDAEEIAQCLPYIKRQIELIQPRLIVALGKTASTALLGKDAPLGTLRGKLHDFNGIPLVVTYHPAYLLRSPTEKAKAWQDLCFAVRALPQR